MSDSDADNDPYVRVLVGCGAMKQLDDEIEECTELLQSHFEKTADGPLTAFLAGEKTRTEFLDSIESELSDSVQDAVSNAAEQLTDLRNREIPAGELYTSSYFALKKEFAKLYGDDWFITSAEHHVIDPETEITTYDKSLTNMTAAERRSWGATASDQLRGLDWEHVDVVVLLMGQLYIEPIEPTLETLDVTIGYPFDHTEGNGEQNQWLKKRIEEAKHTVPDESVTLDLSPIEQTTHNQTSLGNY